MEPTQTLITALAALAGVTILAAAMLKGWQGWLTLKTREIDAGHAGTAPGMAGNGGTTSRIELADLKERVRRLEAIAAGVDL